MRGLLVISLGLTAASSFAAALYTTNGNWISEDFNGLPTANQSTVLNNWVDDVTLPGWYRKLDTDGTGAPDVPLRFRVDDGTGSGGSLCSYGTYGSTDRALGGVPSSNIPILRFGMQLVNGTGDTLDSFSLSFVGEQWRQGNTGAQTLQFSYGLGNSALDAGVYTAVNQLDFTAPQMATANGSGLDGNATPNRQFLSQSVTGIQWLPGQSLWLRWLVNDQSPVPPAQGGGDQGLAVDDFRFQAVPEPMTMLALGAGLAAFKVRKLKLRR